MSHPPLACATKDVGEDDLGYRNASSCAKTMGAHGRNPSNSTIGSQPKLFHTIKTQASILALLISDSKIYAGTQDGDLLIWSLKTYELLSTIHAHRQALLCLSLSEDGQLLFSSAGDAIVNVWSTRTLERLYSIYSKYDVGDVFCVVYSSALQTVYLGAQNTSIQWYNLAERDVRPAPDPTSHPSYRTHRFFDSKGPTGVSTPRSQSAHGDRSLGGRELEIDKDHIVQYAHYGYVYCMLLIRDLGNHRGEKLISGGGDGTINIWNIDLHAGNTITEPTSLENGDESILTLALDGTFLCSGRLEGDVNIWDLETRQLIRRVKAYNTDVLTISVGHGLIFSGSSDGIAKIFNSQHANISGWKAHDQLILASAVASFDGKEFFITGGNDGLVSVWDISDSFDRPSKRSITKRLVISLSRFISYRTISSKPEYAQDCRRGASFLRSLCKQFGAETELLNTQDQKNPVVFARFRGKKSKRAKARTILFYGHYDVIPAENNDQSWHSDPWELHGVNGYLYGRGVSDNKGPVLAALYAVADIINTLSIDIVFLVEGEEESGSRGFEDAIKTNKDMIGPVDWILLANSYWLNDDIPCLTYGLRGVIRATIEVSSERPDLHSGVDGRQLINEALKDLIALLAKLTDREGKLIIPGFYDDIPTITKVEDERFDRISNTLLRQDPGLGDVGSLTASFKARWREPSLTIHRVDNSGPTNSNIISRVAKADISLRLVPNQTTSIVTHALQDFLRSTFKQLNSSNALTIKIEHQAEPWLGDPNNKIFQTLEEAIVEIWAPEVQHRQNPLPTRTRTSSSSSSGPKSPKQHPATSLTLSNSSAPSNSKQQSQSPQNQKPLYIREGGSIPAIRFLEQEFDAPAAHLPCGQASDSAHLDNERLRLLNLYKSRDIFRKVFLDLPLK